MRGPASDELRGKAAALAERMVAVRRRIHACPELGLDTPRTQAVVLEELERMGIVKVRCGKRCTSVVAEIEGCGPGPGRCVVLRADMDALPITEPGDASWVSKKPGTMHACGHDAHVAMLLGAAELLMGERDRFAGTVRLLFQPGEEGFGGARLLIEEGALEGAEAAFALHVEPTTPLRTVVWRPGPIMASADVFEVSFYGRGGHASMPYDTCDPIPAIGPFVDGLSHAVARQTPPNDAVVLSVAEVHAGTASNVIPSMVKLGGTIRTLSKAGRRRAHEQLRRIARGVAVSQGLEAQVTIDDGYPPTVNDPAAACLVAETARHLGFDTREMPTPIMGAEDFSYVLEHLPGAMVFLGCGVPGCGPLHSDRMDLDEAVLPSGAALHVAVALRMLEAPACPTQATGAA